MMSKVYHFCMAFFTLSILLLCSCDSESDNTLSIEKYEISDGIEVNLDSSDYVLISSDKSLKNIFKENAPKIGNIDFKSYNLLYVEGKTPNGIAEIQSKCVASSGKILVCVNIECLLTTQFCNWNQAYLIPKLMTGDIVVEVSTNIREEN